MKVWFKAQAPTVVINFNKFLANEDGEEFFDVAEGVVPEEELWKQEWYFITWDMGTPTLHRREQADIDELENERLKESAIERKLEELKAELDSRAGSAMPKSNSKNQVKMVARQVKLLRKESQGRASADEITELNQSEALDDYLDAITDNYDAAEAWLEDAARTLVEIQGYDVAIDPNWTVQ